MKSPLWAFLVEVWNCAISFIVTFLDYVIDNYCLFVEQIMEIKNKLGRTLFVEKFI